MRWSGIGSNDSSDDHERAALTALKLNTRYGERSKDTRAELVVSYRRLPGSRYAGTDLRFRLEGAGISIAENFGPKLQSPRSEQRRSQAKK